jgi:SAM-dependent methyltransferase
MLAKRLAPFNANTIVLQNELDSRLWRVAEPEAARDVRLLFMGTSTHLSDLNTIVRPAFKVLQAEFGSRVSLDVVGVANDGPTLEGERLISLPRETALAYPAFVAWLQRQGGYEFGLAPLSDTSFNQAKSHIKWLEYSGLGAITLAGDVGEYSRSLRDSGIGLLAAPNAEAFYQTLTPLIDDVDRRRAMREGVADWARGHIARAGSGEARVDRILRLANRDVGIQPPAPVNARAMGLSRRMLSRAFLFGEGIEVGALHNPLAVDAHAKVRYVDRMSREDLFMHYPELREHSLVAVDIIDDGEKLGAVAADSQDFIIANHFLEHCQDPIGTLKNFMRVLKPGAVMFVALPDRRYSFDCDRARTSLAHLIADHHEGPQVSRRDHFHEWATLVEPHFQRIYTGEAIEARVQELMEMDYSIHFHTFEPDDFVALAVHCAENERMALEIVFGGEFADGEMIFILRKTNAGAGIEIAANESAA